MYYSSATSQDMVFFDSPSGAGGTETNSRRLRGFRIQYRIIYASAFFLCAFVYFFVQNTDSVYASTRDDAADYRRQGYEAQNNEEYSQAMAFYYKAVAVEPDNASYWNDIGLAYELMGLPASAEKAYLMAIQMDKNYLAPYANLGHFYKKQQNTVKAIYYFQQRVELGNPADPWTRKAREELEDVYVSSPLLRERFLNEETKRLNLEASQKTRDNFKNQMRVASSEYDRGMLLLKEQKAREAEDAFNASLAFAPQNPKSVKAREEARRMIRAQQVTKHVDRAMQFMSQGNEQAAKQQFREILAIIPNQPK